MYWKELTQKQPFIIAELGKNFIQTEEVRPVTEYIENAKTLIDMAKASGADAVKFQTHQVQDEQLEIKVQSPHFNGQDRYAWVKRNTEATPLEFWRAIKDYAEEKNITFFSTPMSRNSAKLLEGIGVPFWKVGSADILDFVMLDYIAETRKPVIISSGMVNFDDLDMSITMLEKRGVDVAVLYCISQYPCPLSEFNLRTIQKIQQKYPHLVVGFSDHSIETERVDQAAVSLGARIIEKHFTGSKSWWGPDHKASLEPSEFAAMVKAVRSETYTLSEADEFLGDIEKPLQGSQSKFIPIFFKTLVAAKPLAAGSILKIENVNAMRPLGFAEGIPSKELYTYLGRVLKVDISEGAILKPEFFS
ncbi:MAG TPA: N-acetylneuraminate synthase family protein [Patescibacteria group bacterium]|nr:N-acetylneuraminate synthase family protein [Patescibacteria group bacterium]